MNKDQFLKLYNKQPEDESINEFIDAFGFSIVRNYPFDTKYYKDNKKMFIKIGVIENRLFYSVNMTVPYTKEDGPDEYSLVEGKEYKKKVTNFYSTKDEAYTFDSIGKKIIFNKKNSFSINEFIKILVANHLSDRLFYKRIFNFMVEKYLKFIFWLADKKYEKIQVSINKYHIGKNNETIKEDTKNIEPFFKYFLIFKNTIFTVLLVTFFFLILYLIFPRVFTFLNEWPFGDFSLSNPSVVLFFFLILFLCEKFSIWLSKKIKEFFEKESFKDKDYNFIERLHNYQDNNEFKLKIK